MHEILAQIQGYDLYLFKLINQQWLHIYLDRFMPFITNPKETKYILVGAALALLVFYRMQGLKILLGCGLVILLADVTASQLIKPAVNRQRPPGMDREVRLLVPRQDSPSFPSNHAANCFGVATYLGYMFPASKLALLFIASLVAYSRVYVGVHFPFDVAVGAILGIFWGWVVFRLLTTLSVVRRKKDIPTFRWKRSSFYKKRWKT